MQDTKGPPINETSDNRLYVGNLDQRITEATILKMFAPFGNIISEDFLWHTRGPKRGEPRGYAFIQYSSKEEAELAKSRMHGRLACGRPLVVHFAQERWSPEVNPVTSDRAASKDRKGKNLTTAAAASSSICTSRAATIAAIRGKLKAMDEELDHGGGKKKRPLD
ncbi:RNA-binding protein-like RNA recognition motif protein [Wolffia australiana]